MEFRDQLLVFLDGALGIRQGELGALRWLDCDFENLSFSLQHSYHWGRGGHLKCTKMEASAKLLPMHPSLKHALLEWKSQSLYNQPEHFIFPSERLKGNGISAQEEGSTRVKEDRHHRRGLAHFSAHGGNYVGGNGRTSAHDPRLPAAQQPSCHEQVLAGNIEDQAPGAGQTGRRDFADGYLAEDKPNPMNAVDGRFRMEPFSSSAYRPLTSPNLPDVRTASASVLQKNGGDDGTRTRGLCRDSPSRIGFTMTYKRAGTAKIPASRTSHHLLWVGLWVGILPSPLLRKGRFLAQVLLIVGS